MVCMMVHKWCTLHTILVHMVCMIVCITVYMVCMLVCLMVHINPQFGIEAVLVWAARI